jgi:hypothetical protein
MIVAEKLRHFPGLVRLRYWLDTDKPKAGATSIQSEEELKLFKDRMRGLIVPQKLPSGKISTRALKPVRVYFEDAADDNAAIQVPAIKSGSKKVSILNLWRLSSHYLNIRILLRPHRPQLLQQMNLSTLSNKSAWTL